MLAFIIISVFSLFITLVYIKPTWFGFKKVYLKNKIAKKKKQLKFPKWFWLGIVLHFTTLIILWGKFSEPKIIINFAVIPLFWGFTFILDGIVYKRTGGNSLIEKNPQGMFAVGMASISGWLLFEYIGFFIGENWIYPKSDLVGVSQFYAYAIIGSAGLFPMLFEWYSFLNSFEKIRIRYTKGPKISFSKTIQIIILIFGLISLFVVSFQPDTFFFLIWISPILIVGSLLSIIGIWTPFTPIAKSGDWSYIALIALSEVIAGFSCEMWNYFSASHNANGVIETFNPDYWIYSIPYVNVFHIFEMPILGYFGYLPFGVFAWLWYILFSFLLKTPTFLNKINK